MVHKKPDKIPCFTNRRFPGTVSLVSRMSRVNHALGTARVVELFDTRPVELRDVRHTIPILWNRTSWTSVRAVENRVLSPIPAHIDFSTGLNQTYCSHPGLLCCLSVICYMSGTPRCFGAAFSGSICHTYSRCWASKCDEICQTDETQIIRRRS